MYGVGFPCAVFLCLFFFPGAVSPLGDTDRWISCPTCLPGPIPPSVEESPVFFQKFDAHPLFWRYLMYGTGFTCAFFLANFYLNTLQNKNL